MRCPTSPGPGGGKRLQALYDDVLALLQRLGGTPSGEHGDGRLRAGALERFFGPEVMSRFRDVKHAYDPRSHLQPGVILPRPTGRRWRT